ncbi:hypothetical protein [Cupriavidus sp. D39]|uniref:hypothetical protein n=1 Tax=Cupriavidus sp. D39 TaxID=2997877 RepID=UPI00226F80F0|nr:hypothetical protein [Cupriavidus sp. D39]MCY0854816.1 hypothetical protein [Cupriavidus sp. D39]
MVEHRSAVLKTPVSLAAILTEQAWSKARFGILQTIALLAECFPPINAYISASAKAPIKIAADALPGLLFDTLPVVRLLGIRALLPKALERLLRPACPCRSRARPLTAGASLAPTIYLRLSGTWPSVTIC